MQALPRPSSGWTSVRDIIWQALRPGTPRTLVGETHSVGTCVAGASRRHPLLLAPAGSLLAATQAFDAGADAVYVGLKGYSRGGARGELDGQQMRECLALAQARGKQVHLAANIIPRAGERARLIKRLAELADGGLSAVILNDLGLLHQVKQKLPALRITVSIGCGALNLEDVRFYEALSAAAIVLPGNLEPQEIALIRSQTRIELEVMLHMVEEFIQLGKCAMPSYLNFSATEQAKVGGRLSGSVKRGGVGSCFRICQQSWSLLKDGIEVDRRLFPSRQISRISELAEFLDAGVDVIKIQGRSLSPELVGGIIRQYRLAIDAWQSGQKLDFQAGGLPAMWTVQGR